MSIARQFLREFRPLFRLLEEPFAVGSTSFRRFPRNWPTSVFGDPFIEERGAFLQQPAVDLVEEGNHYVVEAELPGIKKENVEIRVGDNGQSLTIEGKTFSRSSPQNSTPSIEGEEGDPRAADQANAAVTQSDASANQLSKERIFSRSSSFSRTLWLPRRVDSSNVSAKLLDGVLTVRIPKADDLESVKVNID